MSRLEDRDYHEGRARDELERADEATDPAIAKVHRELAALHKLRMMAIVDEEAALQLVPAIGPSLAAVAR